MRQWIQSHDRASCQSVITVSPSSSQVLPFQGKAPDTGAHPRLFLLGLNSCDHQGPTSARPESFMKPLLSPLPQLSLFLSPLTRHGLLFPLYGRAVLRLWTDHCLFLCSSADDVWIVSIVQLPWIMLIRTSRNGFLLDTRWRLSPLSRWGSPMLFPFQLLSSVWVWLAAPWSACVTV